MNKYEQAIEDFQTGQGGGRAIATAIEALEIVSAAIRKATIYPPGVQENGDKDNH